MFLFEIYKTHKNKFKFRLIAENGQLLMTSHAYTTKNSCLSGIKSIKKIAMLSPVVEVGL